MSGTTSITSLEAKVEDIVNLGKSWGMTDADIQECLDRAAKEEYACAEVEMSLLRWIFYIMRRTAKISVVVLATLIVLYGAVFVLSHYSPEFEAITVKLTNSYIYPVMRLSRIAFKPLADSLDIAAMYASECIVENPFFTDQIEDCQTCIDSSEFTDLTGENTTQLRNHLEDIVPFVIKGYMKKKVDLTQLQKMYFESESMFMNGATTRFQSNLDNVYNVTDFFYKYNHEDLMNSRKGSGFMEWSTNNVAAAQAIRKYFPRPHFVSTQAEVALVKKIFVDGPIAGGHQIAVGGFVNGWYQQSHGSRRLRMLPHADCKHECDEFTLIVHAGDLVYYQDQYWKLLSEPVMRSGEISIAFSGSFTE